MKKNYFLGSMLLLCFFTSHAQTWTQVWSDEFAGPSISTANWVFETGGGGWGNNELENYTSRAQNATISNGKLLIIARQESYQGSSYTSARMKTQGLQSWTYGKVEAYIKIPTGKGIWPAFWMLGSNISTVSWPACGEIDIMEHVNTESTIEGTIHWDNNGHAQYGGNSTFNPAIYHLYAVEWDASAIRWYLDGVKYHEANIAGNINSTDEFHKPFFILLNLAVGGQWPGNPDNTTNFPDTMYVDYVRVYKDTTTTAVQPSVSAVPEIAVFPNPVHQQAMLTYTVLTVAEVNLQICDVLGREIISLVNATLPAGSYSLNISTDLLPSGVYLIKGSIGGHAVTFRFVHE